jgi:RNA polymerase sigma factor (sigma-70 family)
MSSPPLTDTALVLAARRGDPLAWKHLVERFDRLVRAVCRAHRLSGADADDVRQTTWMRAVEHVDRLQEPEHIGAWLATVARNESLRALRHASRVRPCEDAFIDRVPDPAAAPDAGLLAAERRAAVRRALGTLPARDRAFLGLLYHEGRPSYCEIGRALHMPVGSIGPTRGRVLERLRRGEVLAGLVAAA